MLNAGKNSSISSHLISNDLAIGFDLETPNKSHLIS